MKITFALCALLLAGAVTIKAEDKPKAADKPKPDPEAVFKKKDTNSDGKLSKEEYTKDVKDPVKAEANFTARDKDKDGSLSKEEFTAVHEKKAK